MRRLLPLVLVAVALVPAAALAGLQRRGAHYVGRSSQGHRVTLRVTRDGRFITALDFGRHTNPCGPAASSLRRPGRIRIHRDGTFSDVLNRFGVHDIEEEGIAVSGRFLRGGRVRGRTSYEDRGCTTDRGVTWRAHVVRR
jgi:hypothetical protein